MRAAGGHGGEARLTVVGAAVCAILLAGWPAEAQVPVSEQGRSVPDQGPAPVEFVDSNLPLVVVDTHGRPIENTRRVEALFKVIQDPARGRNNLESTPVAFSGSVGIEIRGQSSQTDPKKQYAVTIRPAAGQAGGGAALLGMPADVDWILQGPYLDRSLMRNFLAYRMSQKAGHYAARARFVEAFIDESGSATTKDHYQGVFLLMESLKRGSSRIAVKPLAKADPSGGYILKIDKEDEGDESFQTAKGTKVLFVYPSRPTRAQRAYLRKYFDSFEAALRNRPEPKAAPAYANYAEVGSFVDFFLLNEFLKNVDAFRISTYMTKDRGGRLRMGPVWDFDRSSGNVGGAKPDGWYILREFSGMKPPFWWTRLLEDERFARRLAERWHELRAGPWSGASLEEIIDSAAALLGEAQERNFTAWPVLGSDDPPFTLDPVDNPTYEGELQELKDFFTARAAWIDAHVEKFLPARRSASTTPRRATARRR
jgi:CotH protein